MRELVFLLFLCPFMLISSAAADDTDITAQEDDWEYSEPEAYHGIADPLAPWNRVMFVFNDKFYFWAFKPVAKGYNSVVPRQGRVAVRNVFRNIAAPIRLVNNVLQGRMKRAGAEVLRFCMNTTVGVLGLFDAAKRYRDIEFIDEDLGQTMGVYGIGNGCYIVWPFLGPSSVRDSLGVVGDGFLDPLSYISDSALQFGMTAYKYLNDNALRVDEYGTLKEEALEPYTALRDAYYQFRQDQIRQ